MSNYVKSTNFTTKDTLPSGNASKIVKGTELDTEFNAIASAISSKADTASPAFTGSPTAPTATSGTNTTQLATTAFVKASTDALSLGTIATQNANAVAITGGSVTGITDLTVADGGTGVSTIAANAVVLGNGASAIQTVAPGTIGNVLTSDGTTWTSATAKVLTSGTAQASTSGTSIDFTGIPSWAKRVTVLFAGVSMSGSSNPLIQIGSGSVATTGYVSTSSGYDNAAPTGGTTATSTAGFIIARTNASDVISGHIVISLINPSTNAWVATEITKNSSIVTLGAGDKILSGTLDRVRITTVNGTDTFDAGSINILYE